MLNSVPWLLSGSGIKDWFGESSEVSIGWDELLIGGVLPDEALGENEDVVSTSEWIRVVGNWLHDDLGVLGCGLVA